MIAHERRSLLGSERQRRSLRCATERTYNDSSWPYALALHLCHGTPKLFSLFSASICQPRINRHLWIEIRVSCALELIAKYIVKPLAMPNKY